MDKFMVEAEVTGWDGSNVYLSSQTLRDAGVITPDQSGYGGRILREVAEKMGFATGDIMRITVEKIDPPDPMKLAEAFLVASSHAYDQGDYREAYESMREGFDVLWVHLRATKSDPS